MTIDDVKTIAVVGAGDMGHGIAEVALIAGYKVFLYDINDEAVNKGMTRINTSLDKLSQKGKVPAEHVALVREHLLKSSTDLKQAVAQADLVIEAAPELMDLKKKIFAEADAAAPAHAILASNTSTMKITEIAKATGRPDKVVGLHYFNPAVLMKLVEVIRGEGTSDETMDICVEFVLKNKKVPVRVEKDVPGFIVNRVQAPSGVLLNAILDSGEVQPEELDATVRKTGAPMGPYETMDYTGLDISVMGSAYYAQAIHPDFKIGSTIQQLVDQGNLGKKTGKGLFDWSNGRPAIDMDKATDKFDVMNMMFVNANEAMKIIEAGACKLEDIDKAIINATGAMFGPMALVAGIEPEDLAARLDGLADRYGKEIFRPNKLIKQGAYR